jgi:ketosteroid isomerase-like protein
MVFADSHCHIASCCRRGARRSAICSGVGGSECGHAASLGSRVHEGRGRPWLGRILSYYADDAVEVPNGEPIITGKVNIKKTMGFLDDKNNHLTRSPVGADISSAGDLGYTYGTYEFSAIGKDGKSVVEHGKYTSIWKKQKDGGWKVRLDMGNASPDTAHQGSP